MVKSIERFSGYKEPSKEVALSQLHEGLSELLNETRSPSSLDPEKFRRLKLKVLTIGDSMPEGPELFKALTNIEVAIEELRSKSVQDKATGLFLIANDLTPIAQWVKKYETLATGAY